MHQPPRWSLHVWTCPSSPFSTLRPEDSNIEICLKLLIPLAPRGVIYWSLPTFPVMFLNIPQTPSSTTVTEACCTIVMKNPSQLLTDTHCLGHFIWDILSSHPPCLSHSTQSAYTYSVFRSPIVAYSLCIESPPHTPV